MATVTTGYTITLTPKVEANPNNANGSYVRYYWSVALTSDLNTQLANGVELKYNAAQNSAETFATKHGKAMYKLGNGNPATSYSFPVTVDDATGTA